VDGDHRRRTLRRKSAAGVVVILLAYITGSNGRSTGARGLTSEHHQTLYRETVAGLLKQLPLVDHAMSHTQTL